MFVEYRNANPRLKNNDYDYFLFETDASLLLFPDFTSFISP